MNIINEHLEFPYAYFITFICYGARLHGGTKSTVDRNHNFYDSPFLTHEIQRLNKTSHLMKEEFYLLDSKRRKIVLKAIKETCQYYNWDLLAAHIRTNHIHIVLSAAKDPDYIMNTIKAYASRYLNQAGLDGSKKRRWAHHGSTRYLWYQNSVEAAIHYVLYEQGKPMEIFDAKNDSLREGII